MFFYLYSFGFKILEGIIQRVMISSKNNEVIRKKIVNMLRWWLKVRSVIMRLVPVLFPQFKKN